MMLVIYGPTAIGKTDLAIKLAKKFGGELISADSRQVYKNLDIGTGKVNFESTVEKHNRFWIIDGVKIHGFDLANPGRQFTAADFIKFASTSLIQIDEVNKLPIIVGGTGFYIKALIDGVKTIGISADLILRKGLEKVPKAELYVQLLKVDKKRAQEMNESDRQNPRRLIRAIEIALSKSSIHPSNQPSNHPTIQPNCLIVGLTAPNQYLYDRADKWLKIRLEKGLIDEVKSLIKSGVSTNWLDQLGLEYRWLTRYVLGTIAFDDACQRLRGDIHDFIRRQKTYFNQFTKIEYFDISQKNWHIKLEKTVNSWYISHSLQANA